MTFGYFGSMKALPGRRDEVVSIILDGGEATTLPGCQLYVVSLSNTDPDVIWVTEYWDTKESHDASLQLPDVRASVAKVLPLLTGEFTSQETTVVGGGLGR